MMISKEEYDRLENEYVKDQFKLADPKPNGMCGTWGWHIQTKKKFAKLMEQKCQD
jgi:hypothetical protein